MSLSEDSINRCEKFIRNNLRAQGILLNPYLEVDAIRAELRNGNDSVESNLYLSRKRIESLKIKLKIEELIEEYLLSLVTKSNNSINANTMGNPTAVKQSNVLCNKLQFEKLCKQFSSDVTKKPVVELQSVKKIGSFKKTGPSHEELSREIDDSTNLLFKMSKNTKDEEEQIGEIINDSFDKIDDDCAKLNQARVSSHELSSNNSENVPSRQDFEISSSFKTLNNLDKEFDCPKIEDCLKFDGLDLCNNKLKEKLNDTTCFSTLPKVRIRHKTLKKQLKHVNDDRISPENLEDKEGSSHDSDEEQYLVLRQSYYQSRYLGRFMKHSSREMLVKKAERLSRRFSSTDFSVSNQELSKMESLTELSSAAHESSAGEDQVDGDSGSILDVHPPFISGVMESDRSSMEQDVDQKLDMRRLILFSLLDSEQKYVKSLESLLEYKQMMIVNAVISPEDLESIFYKIPELQAIHKEFANFLEGELNMSRKEQFIGEAFKNLAIEEFAIAPNYLRNFPAVKPIMHNLSNSKPNFALFLKEIGGKSDANILEELLKHPIIQFQKSTYLLNDLIKYTPAIHSDYDLLQKTLVFAKNFVDQIDSHPSDSESFDKQRYLAKHSLIVEKLNKTRKLRHVFLFNDIIIGAKQKLAARTNSPYEIKWFIPLIEISLEDRPKLEEDKSLEEDHKEEIAVCRRKIKELQNEYQAEYKKTKQSNENAKIKLRYPKLANKSLEKIMKKIKDQEAALVMALPCLSFKIFHHKLQKQHILLMSSDYERSDWKETIIGLMGKARPMSSFSVNDAQLLLNNPQMVKATGAVLDRKNVDEEDYLYGSVHLKINRLQGLQKPTNVFCDVEVDSFGHFEKKARTSVIMKAVEPVWDEVFEIDLEGTQTLRLLCYCVDPSISGVESHSLIGRGAIELRRIWLNNDEKEFTLSLNNKLSLCVTLTYVTNKMSVGSEPTPFDNAPAVITFEDLTRNEADGIPHLVKCCTKIIEERGLKEEGIYRISGNLSLVEDLKKLFETDPQKAEAKAKISEVHTISCVTKLFFRSLPDSLFTGQLYNSFVDALALKDPDAFNKYLVHIMNKLPKANHATAQHMIQHLIKISREETSNKMGLKNLSVVFGPTLVRPPSRGGGAASTDQLFFMAAFETVTQVRLLQQILSLFSTLA